MKRNENKERKKENNTHTCMQMVTVLLGSFDSQISEKKTGAGDSMVTKEQKTEFNSSHSLHPFPSGIACRLSFANLIN